MHKAALSSAVDVLQETQKMKSQFPLRLAAIRNACYNKIMGKLKEYSGFNIYYICGIILITTKHNFVPRFLKKKNGYGKAFKNPFFF